jgi:hypothetical protein
MVAPVLVVVLQMTLLWLRPTLLLLLLLPPVAMHGISPVFRHSLTHSTHPLRSLFDTSPASCATPWRLPTC